MCGITGIYSSDLQTIDKHALGLMAKAIHHRGPDEEGEYLGEGVGLAIQRLRVIDLVTGSQPVFNETKEVVAVFNGEIYNYKELRTDLQKKGHVFSSQSDTETIVHLYEEYGEDFPSHLNGMFAIGLWDMRQKKLLLVRDRAGIKPLFYGTYEGKFLFGSEIKALLAHPGFPKVIDTEAFLDYLSFYYVAAPKTIYKHIRRLPAGHLLTIQNGKTSIKEYWDLNFKKASPTNFSQGKKEFLSVFERSVKRHLQSDVPVGVFLSGGLDSAGIVAMASKSFAQVKTYTIGYEETSYSELKEAKAVADLFKTDHHEYVMTSREMADLLPGVIQDLDEPHGDWSSVPHSLIAKKAKADVTVALNGAGGDELFGGYPTLLAARFANMYKKIPSWVRNGVINKAVECLPVSDKRMSFEFQAKSFVRGAGFPLEEAHRRFKEIFSEEERGKLLQPGLKWTGNPSQVFEKFRSKFEGFDAMDRLMYLDFKVFLAQCPLYVSDMTTSAHAVEGRVPFLDQEMIDFAERVPWQWKINGLTTKYLMREALTGTLPPVITKMKKKGFLIPGAVWIKKDLKPLIQAIVNKSKNELGWLFNFTFVDTLLDDHFAERADNTRRISCLVSFFLWYDAVKPEWDLGEINV